jgi:hypothetical protein
MMNEGDTPWLVDLCKRRYAEHYDAPGAEGWFRNIVLKSPLMFYPARTEHAFVITMLACEPWLPSDFTANAVFTCADDGAMWEVIPLLRDSIVWARKRRCVSWRMWSDTDYDVSPLARRVGATEALPRYALRL